MPVFRTFYPHSYAMSQKLFKAVYEIAQLLVEFIAAGKKGGVSAFFKYPHFRSGHYPVHLPGGFDRRYIINFPLYQQGGDMKRGDFGWYSLVAQFLQGLFGHFIWGREEVVQEKF